MDKKLLLILNPIAGKGQAKNRLYGIVDAFTQADYLTTVGLTREKGDAMRLAEEYGAAHDLVVCVGGDGTLCEMVSGLMRLTQRPVVGYIPTGTTNDFAATLRLPKNPVNAANAILSGRVFPCDVGVFGERHFVYVASFGAFTEVSYNTPQHNKNMLGRLAYLWQGILQLSALPSYRMEVEHDGGVEEGNFIFGAVTNSTSIGGFKGFCRSEVKLDDGVFEVLLIRQPQNMFELQSIVNALMRQEVNHTFMRFFHTSGVRFIAQKGTPWSLDGEYGGAPAVADIRNVPRAIRLVVPDGR